MVFRYPTQSEGAMEGIESGQLHLRDHDMLSRLCERLDIRAIRPTLDAR